jgi:hypothetical protein
MTSLNVKYAALRPVAAMGTDATTGLVLPFAPVSIASLFGGMPAFWGLFIVNRSGVALDATGGSLYYQRQQAQSV